MKLDESIITQCRSSAFNKGCQNVTVFLNNFYMNMNLYCNYHTDDEPDITDSNKLLKIITPKFQRDNNKWSDKMKLSFAENIFKGYRSEILLFKIGDSYNYQIIDGLQRITCILNVLDNVVKPFNVDNIMSYELPRSPMIDLKLYTFNTLVEACQFYIEINENITHSKEDIDKCKDYMNNLIEGEKQ